MENGTEVFMVTGAFHGQQIAVLLDTGAGLTFIAAEVVNRLQLKTRTVPPINIRLGNGSVESVNELVEDTFHLNDMAIPVQAYVMSLPHGIQIIVGMPTSKNRQQTQRTERAETTDTKGGQPLRKRATSHAGDVMLAVVARF